MEFQFQVFRTADHSDLLHITGRELEKHYRLIGVKMVKNSPEFNTDSDAQFFGNFDTGIHKSNSHRRIILHEDVFL